MFLSCVRFMFLTNAVLLAGRPIAIQNVPRAMTFCAAAILGDVTGSLWLVPSELVKIQMQVSSTRPVSYVVYLSYTYLRRSSPFRFTLSVMLCCVFLVLL